MRKRISQQNIFPSFSLKAEYQKLHDLFVKQIAFGRIIGPVSTKARASLSYRDCLQGLFLDWDLRGTFVSVEEMLVSLHISEDDFTQEITEDQFLDYIQFVLNAVIFVDTSVRSYNYSLYQATDTICNAIIDNSCEIVNYLGAEIVKEKKEIFIVYKDDVATAVSEHVPELKASITEYLKIDNRGDLQRKAEVLCTLAKKLEPHEKTMCASEFNSLCTDTTFLLNNIGARHYQNPENRINAQFLAMNDKELEKWYDNTFHMFLACMAVIPYLNIKSDIKSFRSV